jgi:hypothetical protein
MSRSFAQTILILIAVCLFMTLDFHTLRAQEFSSPTSLATGGEIRTDKQLADIIGLVHDSDLRGALMHRRLTDYTYTLVKVKRTLNDQGKVTRELVQSFEAYPVQGQHVLIQISENGSALSPREVAEERRLAGEELERAEREAQKQQENAPAAAATGEPGRYLLAGVFVNFGRRYSNVLIDLSEFLRSCEFSAPHREMVGKREAIRLSFRARADVKFPNPVSFISKLNGTIWIDVADKVVMRLEGWPLTKTGQEANAAQVAHDSKQPEQDSKQSEAAVIYQQVRLPTGLWVPSLIRMNAGGDGGLFNGLNWDVMFEFKDYKIYSTDVGSVEIEKPRHRP